ncbi:MAG TPA: nitroreductase/quinone reductase family protein [Acidimicrobiia bacterium]|nr:nitroreductase/quinone reductase family protein [Acidimicrobiia bacterium]
MGFTPDDLLLLEETREVRIETRRGDRTYRTVIWVVVDDGAVFVRSVRGESGRWYERVLADPDVVLHVAGRQIAARAESAADDESVELTSAALRRKYPPGQSLDSMLRPEVLDTTLRLDPV